MKKVAGYILIAIPVLLIFGCRVASDGLPRTLISLTIIVAFAGIIFNGLLLIERANDEMLGNEKDRRVEDDDEWDCPEDNVSFVGPCTCEHEPEEHGWIGCNVEGCDCGAHFEE